MVPSRQDDSSDEIIASSEQILGSLARELKQPLTYIARRAELSAIENEYPDALAAINESAMNALMLIDSYLLSARSEYGQQSLPLEPVGLGGILYDVAHALSQMAKNRQCTIEVLAGNAGPVMAHPEGLRAALTCLASQLILCDPEEPSSRTIRLNAYKQYAHEPIAAVFDPAIPLNHRDIKAARQLQGVSHMALGKRSGSSGIHLAIADSLALSIGSRLRVVKHQGISGFGLQLIKSEQLQLV